MGFPRSYNFVTYSMTFLHHSEDKKVESTERGVHDSEAHTIQRNTTITTNNTPLSKDTDERDMMSLRADTASAPPPLQTSSFPPPHSPSALHNLLNNVPSQAVNLFKHLRSPHNAPDTAQSADDDVVFARTNPRRGDEDKYRRRSSMANLWERVKDVYGREKTEEGVYMERRDDDVVEEDEDEEEFGSPLCREADIERWKVEGSDALGDRGRLMRMRRWTFH